MLSDAEKVDILRQLALRLELTEREREVVLDAAERFERRTRLRSQLNADQSADERSAPVAESRVAPPGNLSSDFVPPLPQNVDAVLWSDGASRGNPGPAGIGAVLRGPDGRLLEEHSEFLGETTNNVAEYRALIAGLECAVGLALRRLEVRADSELLIKQLRGTYRVRDEKLKPLHARAQELLRQFERVRLTHVPRAQNAEADRLANEGIDGS